MTATVTQLPVRKPQAPPGISPEELSFAGLSYEMGLAEGERRVYARLGIPQPPPSSSVEEYLTATGVAAVLSASRPS